MRVSNIADQIGALAQALPAGVSKHWNRTFRAMCLDMGEVLEVAVQREVFDRQSEPSGRRWDPIAPLTKKVREGTGNGQGSRLGGTKLPASFQVGSRGNVMKIRAKTGFTYGSGLKAGRHLVGRTFAERFKMPRDVVAAKGGGKSAKFYKRKLAQKRSKGAKIRGFMLAVAGVGAPAPGKQLTHPARPILYWVPRWERSVTAVAERYLEDAWVRSIADAARSVKAMQRELDAKHRTSRVG